MRQMHVERAEPTDAVRTLSGGGTGTTGPLPPLAWRLFVVIWLLFLFYPIRDLLAAPGGSARLGLTLAGAALLVGLYLRLALPMPFRVATPSRLTLSAHRAPLILAALFAADILLLTAFAGADWLWFFIFAGIALGARLPARPAAAAIAVVTVLTLAAGLGAFGWVYTLRVALPVAVVGLGVIGVGWLVATIRALREARAEIARLAVAEERLRFARDLHDLLGHSISTITLKNELARGLVHTQPERAVRELSEAIDLAREALREVRTAVSGYRQPSLASELRGARLLLDAAGITCCVEAEDDALPLAPAIEAVLAWTVREGVTNVVRYSGARHCTIAVRRETGLAVAEITDDGSGTSPSAPELRIPGRAGAGLAGLAERAAQVQGRIESGPSEPAGFRLWVGVPLSAQDSNSAEPSATRRAQERVRTP